MPAFYFHLRDGKSGILDDEGQELPDAAAAREYAVQVARELMRACEPDKRHYRLDICDEDGMVVTEVPFATVDPTLDHLRPDLRTVVERLSQTRREVSETLVSLEFLLLRLRTLRGATWRPYLAAQNGQRIP
jgi:hypothetical protein